MKSLIQRIKNLMQIFHLLILLVPGVFILYVALNAEVKFDFYPLINTAAILISAGVIVSVLFMILQKMEDSSTKEEK